MTLSDTDTSVARGEPILTPEEFDAALKHSRELEDKIWQLINEEAPGVHAIAMLGGSLAGRIQSVICATSDAHKAELLALHANVYWGAYHRATKMIPKILLELQLDTLLTEILNDHDHTEATAN